MAKMSAFVFWSGVYNAGLAFVLIFPPVYRALGLNICSPLWGWLIAGFLSFTPAVLILASRGIGVTRNRGQVLTYAMPERPLPPWPARRMR